MLQERGFWVYGFDERGERTIYQTDFDTKSALVIGAEGEGMRYRTKLHCAELVIRRNYRIRGLTPPPIVWSWKMLPAVLFTQFLCMYLLLRAHTLKQIAWRGINYFIEGPGKIRLEKYGPYQPPEQAAPPHHSTV